MASSSYLHGKPYAMTLDVGDEARDPEKHLWALLDEASGEVDRLPPSGDLEGVRAWGYELIQRDGLIARCALILAHRLLRDHPELLEGSPEWVQIETALEWLYRG